MLVGHQWSACSTIPNNDLTLLRRFAGASLRIGQTSDVHLALRVPAHAARGRERSHLQKRVVAEAADGLDPSAAFVVAGVGEQAAF